MAGSTGSLEAALAWLSGQRSEIERLIERLVEVSSHTDDKQGVDEVQARLAAHLHERLGGLLHQERARSERYGDHFALSTARAEDQAPMILIGHADTVFPAGTFEGYRSDGVKAYGPGVLDMKGGLAVVAFALAALHEQGRLGRIPLRLMVVSDEEVGSPESAPWLMAACAKGSLALVFEAGRAGDAIITRRKGGPPGST
jgi:glutamate carboxypeptidase